jgi:3-methylcrotonyl-CoA carboxylase alpha subunit
MTPSVLILLPTHAFPYLSKPFMGVAVRAYAQVRSASAFLEALESTQGEALKGFGNAGVLVEKFIERPRHIEV